MISANFQKHKGSLVGVVVSGHAGFAQMGQDIVCASVTSALQMVANGITEVLGVKANVQVEENTIALRLPKSCDSRAQDFLQALYLHLGLLAQDYSENIALTLTEV